MMMRSCCVNYECGEPFWSATQFNCLGEAASAAVWHFQVREQDETTVCIGVDEKLPSGREESRVRRGRHFAKGPHSRFHI